MQWLPYGVPRHLRNSFGPLNRDLPRAVTVSALTDALSSVSSPVSGEQEGLST